MVRLSPLSPSSELRSNVVPQVPSPLPEPTLPTPPIPTPPLHTTPVDRCHLPLSQPPLPVICTLSSILLALPAPSLLPLPPPPPAVDTALPPPLLLAALLFLPQQTSSHPLSPATVHLELSPTRCVALPVDEGGKASARTRRAGLRRAAKRGAPTRTTHGNTTPHLLSARTLLQLGRRRSDAVLLLSLLTLPTFPPLSPPLPPHTSLARKHFTRLRAPSARSLGAKRLHRSQADEVKRNKSRSPTRPASSLNESSRSPPVISSERQRPPYHKSPSLFPESQLPSPAARRSKHPHHQRLPPSTPH